MRETLQKLYEFIFYALCFLLPLERYVRIGPNILLLGLLLLFPFVIKKGDVEKLERKSFTLLLVFSGYAFLNQSIFHPEQPLDIPARIILSLVTAALILPLKYLRYLKQVFISSVFFCILISIGNMLSFYLGNVESFNFVKGDHIANALPIERLYMGFICVISILLSVDLIGSKYKPFNKYYAINIVLVTAFVLIISSRLGVVLISLLVLLSLFYKSKRTDRIISIMGLVVVLSIAFISNPILRSSFESTIDSKNGFMNILDDDIRGQAWEASMDMLNEESYFVKGLGYSNTKTILTTKIKDRSTFSLINTHNQFIDFLLSAGILVFLLFIAVFIGIFVVRKRDYVKTALLLSAVIFLLVENLYHRQMGSYYLGFIIIFLLFETETKKRQLLDIV